jgi:hypothetical protein
VQELISAGLIAYAISRDQSVKFSRTTRLFLWAFGMSYLSHITRAQSHKPATCNLQRSTFNFGNLL